MTATVVLDQQIRNGTYQSSSVSVPATDPATGLPYVRVAIAGTVSDTDAQDGSKMCRIVVLASWDQGLSYEPIPGPPYDWQGGIGPKGNFTTPSETQPMPVDASGRQADDVMAALDTRGASLNTGLTIDFG